jgi:hypothetical protein
VRRSIALAFAAVACLLVGPTAAQARTDGSSAQSAARTAFTAFPARVLQGKEVTVTVATRAGAMCQLAVAYAGGEKQDGLARLYASRGRASWSWTVSEAVTAGPARVTASCGRAGTASRSFVVVGSLVPPKIAVEQQGFSVRERISGSVVSYGLMLKNLSPNVDALNVYVLVNFVMANGRLIGTDAHTVGVLPAAKIFAYGGWLSFPASAPVERLEVVIQVGGRQKGATHQPALAAVRPVPSLYDPGWVGEVDGEVINDHQTLTLRNTTMWAVVFDAAGNIVGGATGSAFATLPPGTRQVFKLISGVSAVPIVNADHVVVSALGSYGPAGT